MRAMTVRTGSAGSRRGSRRWRRSVLIVILAAVVLMVAASAAGAATTEGIEEVKAFASRLANYVTGIAASVAVLFIAINGLRYAASNGNVNKQLEAKTGIVSAAAGLAIALSANVLVQLVIAALN